MLCYPLTHVGTSPTDDVIATVDGGVASEWLNCTPSQAPAVFFIRIAKCASTALVELLRSMSRQKGFLLEFNPGGAYEWGPREVGWLARHSLERSSRGSAFLYARHFYYADLRGQGLSNYTYVTFVREPVSRFLSSFLYYHFSSKRHIQALLDPTHRNESLAACLRGQHEGCRWNLMTQYFCGHGPECRAGGQVALELAKEHLAQQFAVVGLVEEMELSLSLLSSLLPRYFASGPELAKWLRTVNKNERQLVLSEEESEAIMEANSADLELYQLARQLLHSRAKACGLL